MNTIDFSAQPPDREKLLSLVRKSKNYVKEKDQLEMALACIAAMLCIWLVFLLLTGVHPSLLLILISGCPLMALIISASKTKALNEIECDALSPALTSEDRLRAFCDLCAQNEELDAYRIAKIQKGLTLTLFEWELMQEWPQRKERQQKREKQREDEEAKNRDVLLLQQKLTSTDSLYEM